MPAELQNLKLFAEALLKLSVTTGFAPFCILTAIYFQALPIFRSRAVVLKTRRAGQPPPSTQFSLPGGGASR
jgi:hypothetical protein